MARKRGGLVGTLLGAVEDRTGVRLESASRVDSLEEAATGNARDARLLRRELHNLAYTALDAAPQGHDVAPEERKAWATLARETWMTDPQAGAAVDLLNDFTFGRGVPRPRAKDPKVQEILDEAWDDTDNQLVLTTFNAQIALGTDLQLQSNLFLLLFDDGDDGKVKLGLLNHDTVDDAVRDPENRMRVAYFKATRQETGWDWNTDKPLVTVENGEKRVVYYEHWRNAQTAKDEEEIAEAVDSPRKKLGKPPHDKLGTGRVYHIAVNRTSEQVFGVPTMQRTIRWFTAYNDFMSARVDTAKAAAAFIMKRKVKGTKGQVERMAETALAKTSLLGAASPTMADGVTMRGPAPASVLTENDMVSHEPYTVPTGAGDATSDGQMIRSQISAATHFPQHYLGDAGSANLATATCHDDQTETLTEDGWLSLEKLKARASAGTLPKVASFDIESESIRYESPKHGLLLHQFDGDLVEFRNERHADLAVTPNHRMLVRRDSASPYEFVEAGDVTGRWEVRTAAPMSGGVRVDTFILPAWRVGHRGRSAESEARQERILSLTAAGKTRVEVAAEVGCAASTVSRVARGLASLDRSERPPVEIPMDAWLTWLGWWIAEGSEDATVYQSEDSAWLAEVQAACRALGVDGVEGFKSGRGARTWYWRPRNPGQFTAWLGEHVGVGASNKRIPEFVFALPRDQQMMTLRALMGGDGHAPSGWEKQGSSLYSTTSQGLADDVQRLAFHCGFFTRLRHLSSYPTKRGIRSAYTVALYAGESKRKLRDHGRLPAARRRSYCGEVYCFTLPSSTMVTRRNGVVSIHGQSMELPVLKHVEGRQEVFEQMFRWFLDRAIERAKETERLTDELTDEEFAEKLEREGKKPGDEKQPAAVAGEEPVPEEAGPEQFALAAASGDEADLRDEVDKQRERDFTYEFGLPSPLRRMMGDLVTAVMNIAKTFDPNGTNMELNKILLGVVLGEGLELDDPAAAVDAVFPPGYEDPAVKAFQQQQQNQQPAPGEPPGESPDGAGFYGAPTGGQPPEDTGVMEGRFEDLPGELRSSADQRVRSVLTSFDDDVLGVALSVAMNGNGNGNGKH